MISLNMLEIVIYPNPVLRQKAESVETIDDEIRRVIDSMIEAMYKDEGAGLAAPQVGVSKRIIIFDAGEGLISMINPEIIQKGEEKQTVDEGCLSVPGIRLDVTRPTRMVVRGLNDQGEPVEIEAEGLQARILQHEIDHLNGILIIDHASSIQRTLLRSKLRRLEKKG